MPDWAQLNTTQRKLALEVLHYDQSTWGRTWALQSRFENQTGVLSWVDLTAAEKTQLKHLNWTQQFWDGSAHFAAKGGRATELPAGESLKAPRSTLGCFWDRAKMSVSMSRPVTPSALGAPSTTRTPTMAPTASCAAPIDVVITSNASGRRLENHAGAVSLRARPAQLCTISAPVVGPCGMPVVAGSAPKKVWAGPRSKAGCLQYCSEYAGATGCEYMAKPTGGECWVYYAGAVTVKFTPNSANICWSLAGCKRGVYSWSTLSPSKHCTNSDSNGRLSTSAGLCMPNQEIWKAGTTGYGQMTQECKPQSKAACASGRVHPSKTKKVCAWDPTLWPSHKPSHNASSCKAACEHLAACRYATFYSKSSQCALFWNCTLGSHAAQPATFSFLPDANITDSSAATAPESAWTFTGLMAGGGQVYITTPVGSASAGWRQGYLSYHKGSLGIYEHSTLGPHDAKWNVNVGQGTLRTTSGTSLGRLVDGKVGLTLTTSTASGMDWRLRTASGATPCTPVNKPQPVFKVTKSRFSAICLQSERQTTAQVEIELQVGMPSLIAPFSRPISASMRAVGHPTSETVERAVVLGQRWISDLESVPFPLGLPLLVLHDPPGGASSSEFSDARVHTVITHKGHTVQTGYNTDNDFHLGIDGTFGEMSITGHALALAAPMGIGVGVGVGTEIVSVAGKIRSPHSL